MNVMGNSPLSGQGVNEAYDSRDMDGNEFKDERPNGDNKLAAETKTKIDETSNSKPLHSERVPFERPVEQKSIADNAFFPNGPYEGVLIKKAPVCTGRLYGLYKRPVQNG